ncbi:hypothetical protein L1049_002038 [Liquidambar formosana]|uniref:Morc S5 domain-containing protein n=1 Tax=Liquidambar formosana TaxID=63359 RepID=A0AAP0NEU5_LIQFO
MSASGFIDLCSDDEIGESNAKNPLKELKSLSGTSQLKRNYKTKKVQLPKSKNQSTRQESKENRSSNALGTGQNASSMLDQGHSPFDESYLSSASPVCAAPICRQFWKAGNYDSEQGSESKIQNGKNNLRIHPTFLHSNATSHKWVFGAIAELLDNAVDEIQNGATFVAIDKTLNLRDGSSALLIQDDGGGMDPEAIRRCMSFGYSDKKLKIAIGQYGNGFKTSCMRLGADVIVFSRHLKERTLTQSIGLLSYTFLRQTGHDRIVVPMVDYEFNKLSRTFQAILSHGNEHFSSNLSILLQWSPYSTEEELLKQFDDIGHHGTKVIIYNLWLNDDGGLELDFNSDPEDIRINGDQELFKAGMRSDPLRDQHIANLYNYSLRVYSSILYLRLPQSFRIILRGRVVGHHNIVDDLKFPEFILYKPHIVGNMEAAAVVTTIGFLKDAPYVNIHGFNVYHRNRLILPFWHVVKYGCNSRGRGVVGVLEANFIEPSHNKQDFEKTSLFQKLEARLKEMTQEYWDLHCALIGYQREKKCPPAPLPSQELLSSKIHCSLEPVLMNHSYHGFDSPRAASAGVGFFQDSVATPSHVSAGRPEHSVTDNQIRSQQGLNMKRKGHNPAEKVERAKRHSGSGAYATDMNHTRVPQV